jgi:hypothetical protein
MSAVHHAALTALMQQTQRHAMSCAPSAWIEVLLLLLLLLLL